MAALLQVDLGWMRRAFGWFDAEGRLLARPFAALVTDHAGALAEAFSDVLARFPGHALPLDAGSDSARFLYLGDPDAFGEYPVIGIDHDDLPEVDVVYAGFDSWLADALGVRIGAERAELEDARKRLFGRRKAGWSVGEPWRPPAPVPGPAPGTVAHPAPAVPERRKPRRLSDKQLDKALSERAGDGDAARLRELIADAAGRGRPKDVLDAALVEAAKGGHLGTLEVLLEAGASPNARDSYGQAISRAISYEAPLAVIERLLAAGASPDAASVNGRTALFCAVERGDAATTRALLAAGANPDHADTSGMRPLHEAVLKAPALVDALLAAGAAVDGGRHPRTPLALAIEQGAAGIVDLLIARGADVDRRSGHLGLRPLFVAFENGRDDLARALIAAGADRSGLEVYGPRGEDVRRVVLPAGPTTGTVRCEVRVAASNAHVLQTSEPLSPRWWVALVEAGLGGPDATARLVEADGPPPGPGVLRCTLEVERVDPGLFALVAKTLLASRGARATSVRFESAGPHLEGDAARSALETAAVPDVEVPFPVEVEPGDPAVVFTLAEGAPGLGWGDPRLPSLQRAVQAFQAAWPTWGPPAVGLVAFPSLPIGRDAVAREIPAPITVFGAEEGDARLPWEPRALLPALRAVAGRLHVDLPLAAVRLRIGR